MRDKEQVFIKKQDDKFVMVISGYNELTITNITSLLLNMAAQHPAANMPISARGVLATFAPIPEEVGSKTIEDIFDELEGGVYPMTRKQKITNKITIFARWLKSGWR